MGLLMKFNCTLLILRNYPAIHNKNVQFSWFGGICANFSAGGGKYGALHKFSKIFPRSFPDLINIY